MWLALLQMSVILFATIVSSGFFCGKKDKGAAKPAEAAPGGGAGGEATATSVTGTTGGTEGGTAAPS